MTNSLLLKMTIEIVDFPMKNGGSFQFAMLNHQRVSYTAWWYTYPPKNMSSSVGIILPMEKKIWLVVLTILKNMKVNGKDYSIYCGK